MTEYTDHHGPEGLRTRGTVVVVPGRGETRSAYTRLGRRLAADAYRVRVVDAPELDENDLEGSLARFGGRLADAAEDSGAGQDGPVRPLVLVGADKGAVALAALLGRGGAPSAVRPDGVVLAGIPGGGAAVVGGWEEELDARIGQARDDELPLALVMIDVDDLKTINDVKGHAAGDDLLRAVAQIMLPPSIVPARSYSAVREGIFKGPDSRVCRNSSTAPRRSSGVPPRARTRAAMSARITGVAVE